MTWDYPVTYDNDGQNKIRYLRTKLTYPAEDGDQPFAGLILRINSTYSSSMRPMKRSQTLPALVMITETPVIVNRMTAVFGW